MRVSFSNARERVKNQSVADDVTNNRSPVVKHGRGGNTFVRSQPVRNIWRTSCIFIRTLSRHNVDQGILRGFVVHLSFFRGE